MPWRRPLLWLVLLGFAAALRARREGALLPFRDSGWERLGRREVRLEGVQAGPVRRTRRGWKLLLDVPAPEGPQRALTWLPRGADSAAFEPGRRLSASGLLRPPRRPRDPGDFDEESAAASQGAAWVLHAREAAPSTAPPRGLARAAAAAQRARFSAEAAFERRLPPARAALLSGILLGDAGGLGAEAARAVRDAGAYHLLVASGSNVGFAAAAALAAGLALGAGPRPRAAAAVLAGGFYALMAGADPPCLRAWLMLAALAAARAADRPATAGAALTLAAGAFLAWDPAAAVSTGALMSFGACAALLAAGPRAEAALPRSWPRPVRAAAALALTSAAVAAALWPLCAAAFGRVSRVGPLANLVLVPLSAALMGGGALLWACDALLPAAAGPAARAVGLGLWAFERTCRAAASLPGAAADASPWRLHEAAALALLAAALLARPRARRTSVLAASACAAWAAGAPAWPPPVEAVLLAGVPDAALLRFNGGPAWFVGPKPPGAAARRAARALGAAPIAREVVGRPLAVRLGRFEILVGDRRGPGLRRRPDPFAIIPRPRASALAVVTDGDSLRVQRLFPPSRVRRGHGVPQ